MKWISVKHKLPDHEEYVLVDSDNGYFIANYASYGDKEKEWRESGCCGCYYKSTITHWAEIEPPQKGDKNN